LAININSNTNIEASVYPVLHINNMTDVCRSEAEMVGGNCRNQSTIPVQVSEKSNPLIPIAQLVQDTGIFILCNFVFHLASKQAKRF
jgi:hypothetical protein